MVRKGILVMACIVALGALAAAQEPIAPATPDNLSDLRTFGIGIQVDFPWGGLISGRYWVSPSIGLEGVLFVWGDPSDYEGSVTARALLRVADAAVVDFYVAPGVTVPFSTYGENHAIFSAVGGIEFSFGFARNLAWNIEFGLSYSTRSEIQMVLGTGVHFYF
jgi:hypothetical protein